MAFVVKKGKRYQVRQGNSEAFLKSFTTRAKANEYVAFLHKKNKPEAKNKGTVAKKRAIKSGGINKSRASNLGGRKKKRKKK